MASQKVKYPKLRDWFDKRLYEYGGRRYGSSSLADDLGVAASVATNWSNGIRAPEEFWIYSLAFHFRCDPTEIFEALDQKPRNAAYHRLQIGLCLASDADREKIWQEIQKHLTVNQPIAVAKKN